MKPEIKDIGQPTMIGNNIGIHIGVTQVVHSMWKLDYMHVCTTSLDAIYSIGDFKKILYN